MKKIINKTLKLMYFNFIMVLIILVVCTLIIINRDFDLLSIIFLLFELYILFSSSFRIIKNKQFIKSISSKDKEEYEVEISNSIYTTKENYIFTENYVFFFEPVNIEICKYEDILLVYKKLNFRNRVGPQESYYILTRSGNIFKVLLWSFDADKNNKDFDLQKLLIDKNTKILIGKTKENKKIIKEKYKLKI